MNSSDLKNKTLGIVSSYGDNCGNATYTKQLMSDLKGYFKKVECIELDQRLINSEFYGAIRDRVLKQVKSYDFINIQCEPGLFHKQARKAIKFIESIIDARGGNDISITFHSVGIVNDVINLSDFDYKIYKIKFFLNRKLRKSLDLYKVRQAALLRKVKQLQKLGKNISVIVHQKELSEKLALLDIESYFHPIVSANNSDVKKFDNPNLRNEILEKYNLDKNLTYVGGYGFYGPYKGIDVLIDSIKFLPDNFHLILSSNCHPIRNLKIKSIVNYKQKNGAENSITQQLVEQDEYMVYLMNKIIAAGIVNRVHFVNHILDEGDFKALIAAMDISVFPYYEVGQQGSGPVSYSTHLSYSGKIILSRTNLFETYEKNFFHDCFAFFDQGNSLELSYKIKSAQSKKENLLKARSVINPDSNVKTYINSLIKNQAVDNFLNQSKFIGNA